MGRCFGTRAEIIRQAGIAPAAFKPCPISEAAGTLASLRAVVAESRIALPPGLPPMAAGLVGYMGYDMVRLIEKLPDNNPEVLRLPEGMLLRPTVLAVFDTIEDTVTVITPVWPDPDIAPRAAYGLACQRLADVVADFGRSLPYRRAAAGEVEALAMPTSNVGREGYYAMVERARDYI